MASAPFKYKADQKYANEDPILLNHYWIGIPRKYWSRLIQPRQLSYIEEVQQKFRKGVSSLLLHSTSSDTRLALHAFSVLSILNRSGLNGCAIPVDRIGELRGKEYDTLRADFLMVHPLSLDTPKWKIEIVRCLWDRFSMVVAFRGKPSQFEALVGQPDKVVNTHVEER